MQIYMFERKYKILDYNIEFLGQPRIISYEKNDNGGFDPSFYGEQRNG